MNLTESGGAELPKQAEIFVPGGAWVQVSRLGMPLVNEVVIGLKDKDKFNASEPKDDGQFADYVTNPTLPALLDVLFRGAVNQTLGTSFTNIRIKAGANPKFNANTVIRGVVYVETPNQITFNGGATIQGVIVVQNNPTGDITTASRSSLVRPSATLASPPGVNLTRSAVASVIHGPAVRPPRPDRRRAACAASCRSRSLDAWPAQRL